MDRPIIIEKTKRLISVIAPFAWLAVLVFAIWSLQREWSGVGRKGLSQAISQISLWQLGFALLLTAASLVCNASLDLVALRWLKRDLPTGRVLGTALIASSFSMNGGGTILGGGTIRMRFYGQYGLGGGEIAKMTGFLLVAGWLGHALLAGMLLSWSPTFWTESQPTFEKHRRPFRRLRWKILLLRFAFNPRSVPCAIS